MWQAYYPDPLAPWICATLKLASPSELSCLKQICRFFGLLGSISFTSYFKTAKFKKSKNQVQVFKIKISSSSFKNKVSSSRIKRGQEAQPLSANLKRGQRTHQKEAHSPLITATNMPTTRSQSKAMSTPPISSVLEEPESPKSTSSQETPWSTQSINNTSPLGNQLSPGWVHAITIIMGKSLQSEVGEMLQKWIHYHIIPDNTEFWFSSDPSDPEDFRLLQKYEESDGSIAYLPNNLAKNLVSLWDFMNLLMKKDRPDGENNKLYYLMDEQWTKFTAYDTRSALIDEKRKNKIHTCLQHPQTTCHTSGP